jgi:8-oxo-dGTP diphosphatase
MPRPVCPPIAADMITEIDDRIVLIERKNFPEGWAIPGGFVDFGETVEQAAIREAKEEISVDVEIRALLGIYSKPDLDPRGQTITAVDIGRAKGTPAAADDAKNCALFDPRNPPQPLAFDHSQVLRDYVNFLDTGEHPAPWKTK